MSFDADFGMFSSVLVIGKDRPSPQTVSDVTTTELSVTRDAPRAQIG